MAVLKTPAYPPLSTRLKQFITEFLEPAQAQVADPVVAELQDPKVDAVLAKHDKQLKRIFAHYAASDASMGDSDDTINFDEYNTLLMDTKLVDSTLTKKISSEIFVRCNLSGDEGLT